MNDFSQVTWVCGHIGFANDSLTVFLNLHTSPGFKFGILRQRMRSSRPGILLNWAWYYPKWTAHQVNNPVLFKQLCLGSSRQFCQAHFVNRESALLNKFPNSNSITVLVEDELSVDTFARFAHYKLLDRKLYTSWYEVQKSNFPLTIDENKKFADEKFKSGLTALQYRCIAFQDWQGKLVTSCSDPIAEWNEHQYHYGFMENKNTILKDCRDWQPALPDQQTVIYIDRLVCPRSQTINEKYYKEICDRLSITPNVPLLYDFWKQWLQNVPSALQHVPQLSWDIKG